jgi:hypothetical protein
MMRAEIELIRAWLVTRMLALRATDEQDKDRGSVSVETVIWWGIAATIAITIGAILIVKVTAKANEITLQ